MKNKIAFTSLGCDKNRVDSEVMLGILQQKNFEVSVEEEADIIVINTCCFIKDALEESIETILELSEYKNTGNCKGLIVAGCLGQRYQDEFFDELPEVDAVIGTGAYESIAEVAEEVLKGKTKQKYMEDIHHQMEEDNAKTRVLSTAFYMAYLKISEGCDNHCTYCVIPKLRGKHRSRHIESLVEEASILAKQGVKELVLVAQDSSIYGRDIYNGEQKLPELMEALSEIEGIEWIRLLYCYPETLTQKTIDTMAKNPKICKYIDMPIQHASNNILKRMGRKTTQEQIKQKIEALREAMKDIAIRTTIITGFPQETEEEFAEVMTFVEEMQFDKLGVFSYSQEEGTPAGKMNGQIPDEIKEERRESLMNLQKEIVAKKCEKMVGKEVKVLIEGRLPEEEVYCARTQTDAPDIDGLVFVRSEEELISGDFYQVKIVEALDYDLIGEILYEE